MGEITGATSVSPVVQARFFIRKRGTVGAQKRRNRAGPDQPLGFDECVQHPDEGRAKARPVRETQQLETGETGVRRLDSISSS